MQVRLLFIGLVIGALSCSAFARTQRSTDPVDATPTATSTSVDKPAKKRSAQQEKMARCNHDAVGKKGAERKAFMKACLKGA